MNQQLIQQRPKQHIYLFLFFLALVLFIAFNREWEYDEAWSYMGVQHSGFADILRYTTFHFANNHLINSLYFKALQSLGLRQVFFFRLLSIAGFVLFYIAASGILSILKINYYFIVFLLITPFFLHFSMGRGYSLALGSFAMSVLYLLKYKDNPGTRYEYGIVLFGALATLSIFSFLFGFLATCFLYAVLKLKAPGNPKNIHTLILSLITAAVVLYVYHIGKIINSTDPDIVGSDSLMKSGTISSIFTDLSFFSGLKYFSWYKYFKIAVIASLILLLVVGWRRNSPVLATRTLLLTLIGLSLLLMIAAHVATGAKYPLGRAVFYLEFLLLLVALIPIASSPQSPRTPRSPRTYGLYLPLFLLCFASGYHIYRLNVEFRRPGFRETLAGIGTQPVYAMTIDPALYLINEFYFQKPNITQRKTFSELLPIIGKDSNAARYLLFPPDQRDSIRTIGYHDLFPCREGFILAEITH